MPHGVVDLEADGVVAVANVLGRALGPGADELEVELGVEGVSLALAGAVAGEGVVDGLGVDGVDPKRGHVGFDLAFVGAEGPLQVEGVDLDRVGQGFGGDQLDLLAALEALDHDLFFDLEVRFAAHDPDLGRGGQVLLGLQGDPQAELGVLEDRGGLPLVVLGLGPKLPLEVRWLGVCDRDRVEDGHAGDLGLNGFEVDREGDLVARLDLDPDLAGAGQGQHAAGDLGVAAHDLDLVGGGAGGLEADLLAGEVDAGAGLEDPEVGVEGALEGVAFDYGVVAGDIGDPAAALTLTRAHSAARTLACAYCRGVVVAVVDGVLGATARLVDVLGTPVAARDLDPAGDPIAVDLVVARSRVAGLGLAEVGEGVCGAGLGGEGDLDPDFALAVEAADGDVGDAGHAGGGAFFAVGPAPDGVVSPVLALGQAQGRVKARAEPAEAPLEVVVEFLGRGRVRSEERQGQAEDEVGSTHGNLSQDLKE